MGAIRIVVEDVARYLLSRELDSLTGIWFVLEDKMTALGLSLNKRAALTPAWSAGGSTGNVRGILDWVESVDGADAADVECLVALHATLRNRFAAAGYAPERPKVRE